MIESFRVTSIQYNKNGYIIFSGIPLESDSASTKSARYIVTVKTKLEKLPVTPSVGQNWEIEASYVAMKDIAQGNYKLMQHTYSDLMKIECTLPESGDQLIKFIAKETDFVGIGEHKARLLWQKLGADFHSVVGEDSDNNRSRLREVLTEPSIDALYKGYNKYKNLSAYNWLTQHNIPVRIQQRLLKFHNNKSVDAIKENPYTLIGFGLSFADADKLATEKFNIYHDDEKRLSASVEMAIRAEVEKGHTYTKQQDIKAKVSQFLGSAKLATQAFSVAHEGYQFLFNKDLGTYHPTAQIFMETVVSKRLFKLKSRTNLFDTKVNKAFQDALSELPYELTAKQRDAVIASLDNAVSCVTGGAGTGKTTVLRTILRAFFKQGVVINAVALSGRAAMRLHESIGFKTSTIAAFLKNKSVVPDLITPDYLLVIDEASMIDLPTMYRIVTHIHPSVKIILTGDPDQLPPIGCGKVLADIVDSKVIANTMLDIVKRQEGSTGIPEYSKMINQGIVPESLSFGAIHFHETPGAEIAEKCTDLFALSPNNSRLIGSTRAIVSDINSRCQDVVNPDSPRLEFELTGERFFRDIRLNDAVLFTQNDFSKGIQNGTLGVLTSVKTTEQTEFEEQSFGVVTIDNNEGIKITKTVLDCMEVGYCITLHKAQGSQFPRIIIALQKGRITDRAWLYTAITRAESEIHIVGSADDFASITKEISHVNKRNSYLKDMIKKVCDKGDLATS